MFYKDRIKVLADIMELERYRLDGAFIAKGYAKYLAKLKSKLTVIDAEYMKNQFDEITESGALLGMARILKEAT